MARPILLLALLMTGACGTTSYGAATDGVFPPKPAGADYPNWEHMCAETTQGGTTAVLNESGAAGWELVAVGTHRGETLVCFRRPKTGS